MFVLFLGVSHCCTILSSFLLKQIHTTCCFKKKKRRIEDQKWESTLLSPSLLPLAVLHRCPSTSLPSFIPLHLPLHSRASPRCLLFSSVRSHLLLRSIHPNAAWGPVQLSEEWMMGNWVPTECVWHDLLTFWPVASVKHNESWKGSAQLRRNVNERDVLAVFSVSRWQAENIWRCFLGRSPGLERRNTQSRLQGQRFHFCCLVRKPFC